MVDMRQQIVVGGFRRINGGVNSCRSITVHETGNPGKGANAAAHANLQSRAGMGAISWHWTVDDHEAVQSYEHAAQCRHAGSGTGNNTSIGVEICVNSDGDYEQTLRNAAELVAWIMKNESIDLVYQHNVWWGKNCPQRMREGGYWDDFLDAVFNNNPTAEVVTTTEEAIDMVIVQAPGKGNAILTGNTFMGINNDEYQSFRNAGIEVVTVRPETFDGFAEWVNR